MISVWCLTPIQKNKDSLEIFSENEIHTYGQCQVSAPGAEFSSVLLEVPLRPIPII